MRRLLSTTATVAIAALVGVTASPPSYGAQRSAARRGTAFDGSWSVLLQTTRGSCPTAVRAGVRIIGGRLLSNDPSYGLHGRVASGGAVRVTVSAAGQTGGAFGHLSRAAGRGHWRTSSGQCAGEWSAARE